MSLWQTADGGIKLSFSQFYHVRVPEKKIGADTAEFKPTEKTTKHAELRKFFAAWK